MASYRAVAVTGLKGGVGKSTIAINLAAGFHAAGRKTLLVDSDTQGTARTWAGKGAQNGHDVPPVVGLDARTIVKDLPRVGAGYEYVVIDSPARLGAEARAAMMVADLALLPVIPGAADVWALKDTLAVLDEAKALRPQLEARIVMNCLDHTTLAGAMVEYLERLGVEVMEESLGSRVAFGNAMLDGLGVAAFAPGSPAADEVKALVEAVASLLSGKKTNGKTKKAAR